MLKTFISGVAVGIIALYAFGGVYARTTLWQQADELALPNHWVPYVATRVFHTAHGDQIARAYRNSRGSTATYFQPDGVGPVTIHNAETGLTYARVGAKDWISFPLETAIPQTPPTVARYKRNSVSRLEETVASFPVYAVLDGVKMVPELNGLIVAIRNPNGFGDELVDIVVQEPSAELFLPPSGVAVKRLSSRPVAPVAERDPASIRQPSQRKPH